MSGNTGYRLSSTLILPTNDVNPAMRGNYTIKVNHLKTYRQEKDHMQILLNS